MIGIVGVGDMRPSMGGHILAHGFDVIAALLCEQQCTYLGRRITPSASSEGGL